MDHHSLGGGGLPWNGLTPAMPLGAEEKTARTSESLGI